MRVLVVNDDVDDPGGVRTYLTSVLPGFVGRGHTLAFLHRGGQNDRNSWTQGCVDRTFGVRDQGLDAVLDGVSAWSPEVCFSHNMRELDIDQRLLSKWPVVKLMHGYFGTCVSGRKSFASPRREPCSRRLGLPCLALYLPRRCGHLRVNRILGDYRWATRQRALFANYAGLIVASDHMRAEYIRGGADPDRVTTIPLFRSETGDLPAEAPSDPQVRRVVFFGRMTPLKGGDVLVHAIAEAQRVLDAPIALTMAGDGPQRVAWERLAQRLGVDATFPGWVDAEERERVLATATLVALPSVWPEPFGLVGLEAAGQGVPAIAFDVGGMREWLRDGHNGVLVPASPPTSSAFAKGLVSVLRHGPLRARLRTGAVDVARQMSLAQHLDRLEAVLTTACSGVPVPA